MAAASSSMIFDSLPYYDNDLEQFPILRAKVDQELAKEGQPPSELHPSLAAEYELFVSQPLLLAEMKRVEAGESLTPLDNIRYQLPAPSTSDPSDEDWRKSLDNANAQLEHQMLRQSNLALLQQYGANTWRVHNYRIEAEAKSAEKELEYLKQRTVDVNRERKNFQERVGGELTYLEKRWTELISGSLQIEIANAALIGEIDRLNLRESEMAGVV